MLINSFTNCQNICIYTYQHTTCTHALKTLCYCNLQTKEASPHQLEWIKFVPVLPVGQVEEKKELMVEDTNENSNLNNPVTNIKAEVCICICSLCCELHGILIVVVYARCSQHYSFYKVKAASGKKKMLGELPRRKSNLAVDVNTYQTLEHYERVENHLKSMPNES